MAIYAIDAKHLLRRRRCDAPRVDTAATFFEPTLKAWNIPYTAMNSDDDIGQIDDAFAKAEQTSLPAAVLIVPETV